MFLRCDLVNTEWVRDHIKRPSSYSALFNFCSSKYGGGAAQEENGAENQRDYRRQNVVIYDRILDSKNMTQQRKAVWRKGGIARSDLLPARLLQ